MAKSTEPAAAAAPKIAPVAPKKRGKLSGKARARADLKNILAQNGNKKPVFRRAGIKRAIIRAALGAMKEFGIEGGKLQFSKNVLAVVQTFIEEDGRRLFKRGLRVARDAKVQAVRVRHLQLADDLD